MRWDLLGPRRFMDDVVTSLHDGKHVVLVLPRSVASNGFESELGRALRRARLGELSVVDVGPGVHDDPLDALSIALDRERPFVSIEEAIESDDASRFVLLEGIDHGEEKRQRGWAKLLEKAACYTQMNCMSQCQLIGVVNPETPRPVDDLFLAVHKWWGVIQGVDLDWVVQLNLDEYPPETLAGYYWRWALCRGLAVGDPALAAELTQQAPRSFAEVFDALEAYGARGGAEEAVVDGVSPEVCALLGDAPVPEPRSGAGLALWRDGWLNYVRGRGIQVHSALLAVHGDREEILRRVWSGQQETLLPVVEQVRLVVLRVVEQELGGGWLEAYFSDMSPGEQQEHVDEIGRLVHLFNRCSRLRRVAGGVAGRAVRAWRRVRNALAHAEAVEYDVMHTAFSVYQELQAVSG